VKYIAVFILTFASFLLKAQNSFLAYQVVGTVTYKENGKEQPVKVGKVLTGSETVTVGKNSKILLVCENTSRTITLKQGEHKLDDLSGLCKAMGASLSSSFLKYVWWQFTHPHFSPEDERGKVAGVGGGVSRGCSGIELNNFFDTVCYYRENIIIQWKSAATFTKKEFVIYEYENAAIPIMTFTLKDNSFRLDKLKGLVEDSTAYFWNIRVDDKEVCPRKLLQVWNKNGYTQLLDSIRQNMVMDVDKAEENYMLGYFLEVNHFYGEAYKYYKAALAAKPGDTRYKNTVTRIRQTFTVK